tara:strand:- start:3975 stop:7511 length:3537 start_codon:yes stop_codon:yes gene_type:complete
MAITNEDMALMRSERETDNADGGGMMTGTALAAGNINQLWDDVDSTEMAGGGVSIRRFFPKLHVANNDKLLGGRVAIIKDADADNVSTLLVYTGDHYAQRSQIREAVESFYERGTRADLRPVGTQRAGQRALVMYSDTTADTPVIGAVLVLKNETLGRAEFVKITSVTRTSKTYAYDNDGAVDRFVAHEFVLGLSRELDNDFAGLDPAPTADHPTKVYSTQARSSARYYGLAPLAQAAAADDDYVIVDDVTAPVVPVATTETALVDEVPGVATRVVQASGARRSDSFGSQSGSVVLTLPVAWVPGSLVLTVGASQYVDKGNALALQSGSERLTDAVVSAADGRLTLVLSSGQSVSASYVPGVAVTLAPYTVALDITSENRQLTYTGNLQPAPDVGMLRIEYMSSGEWYGLTDDGAGVLSGAAGATGSIDYDTGSYSLVLAAEPDVSSVIIFTFGKSPYLNASGSADAALSVQLSGYREPGTAVISWNRGNSSYTLTEQSDGTFSGSGTAEIVGQQLRFVPSSLPDSAVTVSYSSLAAGGLFSTNSQSVNEQAGGSLTLQTVAGVDPASVIFWFDLTLPVYTSIDGVVTEQRTAVKAKAVGLSNGDLWVRFGGRGVVAGVVDVVTGQLSIDLDLLVRSVYQSTRVGDSVAFAAVVNNYRVEAQLIDVLFFADAEVGGAVTEVFELADLSVDVVVNADLIVPGSLVFTLGSTRFVDSGTGSLLRAWSYNTAAGVACGSVNYADGSVSLVYADVLAHISSLTAAVQSLAAGVGASAVATDLVFRTAGAPLRPSGLQVLARRAADTALISAASAADGVVSGVFDSEDTLAEIEQAGAGYALTVAAVDAAAGSVSGAVDYGNGVVRLAFTQPVLMDSLTYSAVVFGSLPLDPDVIGLDPLRLPASGRVQVFAPGGLALVHNTQSIELAAPVAGQVVDCGRGDLAVVRVLDAAGNALAADQYGVDKSTGLVTLADPFDAVDADGNSLTMPLTLDHRVQDLVTISAVRLDGRLSFLTELNHDYPAGSVCSAVIRLGDLQGRTEGLFEQTINVSSDWSDELAGDSPAAQYDALNYPLQVDNFGAVTERWKLLFRTPTSYAVIGEQRGVIADYIATDSDYSPINPMTGTPYFTVYALGFGSGWVTGNVIRFNTVSAAQPIEAVRTVTPSRYKLSDQSVYIEFMGDAD